MLDMLKGEYRQLFAFLKGKRRFWRIVFAAALLFSVAAGVGLHFYFVRDTQAAVKAANVIAELFASKEGLVDETGAMSAWGVFKNNIVATFLLTMFGVLPFLFLPGIYLGLNVAIIGVVSGVSTAMGTLSAAGMLALLIPHGVFEIPALCLGAGCGLLLCGRLTAGILHPREQHGDLTALLYDALRTMVLLITPLLAVAALVETYVTPLVAAPFL